MSNEALQNDVTQLKVDVGKLETKLDNQDTKLNGIKTSVDRTIEILQSFLLLEQKHSTLQTEFTELKNDYQVNKTEIVKAMGMVRGVMMAGMIFVSAIIGLGLYIYSDKIELLNKHEQRIEQLEHK